MTRQGATTNNAGEETLTIIEQAILTLGFGSVTLVIQDSRIIQLEKLEKIRLGEKPPKAAAKTAPGVPLRNRILQSVSGMEFGRVVIQVQAGQISQVERTEKYRIDKLAGIYGDGI